MKREIDPQNSSRAEVFRLWMSSSMPMVTLVKTLDVSRLIKVSKKSGMKFTMLMCWCVGKAANIGFTQKNKCDSWIDGLRRWRAEFVKDVRT